MRVSNISHRITGRLATAAFVLAMSCGAGGAQDVRVGVAAPLSGPSTLLGEQVSKGAAIAAASPGSTSSLEIVDDACTADGGRKAADAFIERKVDIVVGFLCTESIEAALPVLKAAAIPVVAIGVRTDSLTDRRDKTGWPVWRLGPRADGERTAINEILVRDWRTTLFAIIDDGTIYGRELAESFRMAAEQAALKPVFVDTFRPQMDNQVGLAGRLRKAGATHVFVGGDRDDIAILGRDARGLGMELVIAGGENLRAAANGVPLSAGTLMIAAPEWADRASTEILARFTAAGATVDGYALPAHAAVEIAVAALQAAASTAQPVTAILADRSFSTAIGTVDFDAKGDLASNPYVLFLFDGSRFVEVRR